MKVGNFQPILLGILSLIFTFPDFLFGNGLNPIVIFGRTPIHGYG